MAAFVDQVTEPIQRTDGAAGQGHARSFAHPLSSAAAKAQKFMRARRIDLLERVVAAEILPRLALARRAAAGGCVNPPRYATTDDDTAELVNLVRTQDASAALAFVELLCLRGATIDSLNLGVLTDAARRLGDLWLQDRSDFAEVTIATGRLQQVLRGLSRKFQPCVVTPASARSVLLIAAPGEQHTLGLLMLGEFFRRAGWRITSVLGSAGLDAAEAVRNSSYDVAAFSTGSERLFEPLARSVHRVRRASCNPGLGVLVGGPLFLLRPDLVGRVGADATAIDAPGAVRAAHELLTLRAAAE
jgi:MerR family transcriptional regulator, light-induced transcriptional regulator